MISVKEIVKKYLSENGYDGLYNDGVPCGCDGTCPYDGPCPDCVAAVKGSVGNDSDGHVRDFLYYPDPRSIDDVDKATMSRIFSSRVPYFLKNTCLLKEVKK